MRSRSGAGGGQLLLTVNHQLGKRDLANGLYELLFRGKGWTALTRFEIAERARIPFCWRQALVQ